jgi:hypothetical protein
MTPEVQNLIRVTGMGSVAAEAFLKSCSEKELAIIRGGEVQRAMDVKADRLQREAIEKKRAAENPPAPVVVDEPDEPTDVILVNETPLPAGTPAASPSDGVSEAPKVEDDPDLP